MSEDETTFLCGLKRIPRYGTTSGSMNQHIAKLIRYRVRPCDTLPGIALKFDSNVCEIKRLNKLWSHESLALYDTLLIPLYKEFVSQNAANIPDQDVIGLSDDEKKRRAGEARLNRNESNEEVSAQHFFSRIDNSIKRSSADLIRLESRSTVQAMEPTKQQQSVFKGKLNRMHLEQ